MIVTESVSWLTGMASTIKWLWMTKLPMALNLFARRKMIRLITAFLEVANWRLKAICLNLLKQTCLFIFSRTEVFSNLNLLAIRMVKVTKHLQPLKLTTGASSATRMSFNVTRDLSLLFCKKLIAKRWLTAKKRYPIFRVIVHGIKFHYITLTGRKKSETLFSRLRNANSYLMKRHSAMVAVLVLAS